MAQFDFQQVKWEQVKWELAKLHQTKRKGSGLRDQFNEPVANAVTRVWSTRLDWKSGKTPPTSSSYPLLLHGTRRTLSHYSLCPPQIMHHSLTRVAGINQDLSRGRAGDVAVIEARWMAGTVLSPNGQSPPNNRNTHPEYQPTLHLVVQRSFIWAGLDVHPAARQHSEIRMEISLPFVQCP